MPGVIAHGAIDILCAFSEQDILKFYDLFGEGSPHTDDFHHH